MRFGRYLLTCLFAVAIGAYAGACSDGTNPPDARPSNMFDAEGPAPPDAPSYDAPPTPDAPPMPDAAAADAPEADAGVDAT